MYTRRNTETEFLDAKQSCASAIGELNSRDRISTADRALDRLEELLSDFNQRGQFEQEDERSKVHRNSRASSFAGDEDEARKEKEAGYVSSARVSLAVGGLRLLQKTIPQLQEMAVRCIESAGKDAVRVACGPTYMGDKAVPSEFTLPSGYEPGLAGVISKVKKAVSK